MKNRTKEPSFIVHIYGSTLSVEQNLKRSSHLLDAKTQLVSGPIKQEAWGQIKRKAKKSLFQGYDKAYSVATIVIYLLTLLSLLFSVYWSYWILTLFVLLMWMSIGSTQKCFRAYNSNLRWLIHKSNDEAFLDGTYYRQINDGGAHEKLEQTFTISSGAKEGNSNFIFLNGVRFFSVNYKSGVLHGSKSWYDSNGRIVREETYFNGELSDMAIEYYSNGNKRMVQDGDEFMFFDEKGNLRVKIGFTREDRDLFDFYSVSGGGVHCVRHNYSPVGDWCEYDLKGEVCKTYRFSRRTENGKDIRVCTEHTSLTDSDPGVVVSSDWVLDLDQFVPSRVYHRHVQAEGEEDVSNKITGRMIRKWTTRPIVKLSDLFRRI